MMDGAEGNDVRPNEPAGDAITFSDPETRKCPFHAYDVLRETTPVYRDPGTGSYVLTRFSDVRPALFNTRALSNDVGMIGQIKSDQFERVMAIFAEKGLAPGRNIQTYDPPEHKLHRAPAERGFDHWNVKAAQARIAEQVDSLLDRFIDAGRVEFVSEFAVPLPIQVIAMQLGIPPEDGPKFKLWVDTAVEVINPNLPPEREIETAYILRDMYAYFGDTIERVRANPDETLISKLVQTLDENGDPLGTPELLELMRAILVAGGETTTFGLSGGMKLLIENPDAVAEMQADPEKIGTFVEETLRIISPVQTMFRRAKQDLELHDVTIPKGAVVEARYGAANRDPAKFECPNRVDLSRRNAAQHVAFGAGPHICLGMQLARAEMHAAFEKIIARMENFRMAKGEDSYEYSINYIAHGLTRLDLTFDRRRV